MPDPDDTAAPPPPQDGADAPQPAPPIESPIESSIEPPIEPPIEPALAPHDTPHAPGGEACAPAQDGAATPVARPAMSPAECAQRLAALFPALFAGAPKPLKLRVHADIQARAPGVFPRAVLSAFMRRHTGSTAYLNAVARGAQRFGLDGEPAGEIAAEHRQAALDELARRRTHFAGQREREAEQRARDEQQRRARAALLRDFERTTLTRANFCALKGVAEDELDHLLEIAREEAAHPPVPSRARAPRHDPRAGRARR